MTLCAGATGGGDEVDVDVEGGADEADEAEEAGDAAAAELDATEGCLARLCAGGFTEGGSFNDTSWPEKAAASAVSLAGVAAGRFAGFAACAVDPPPLAARDMPKAAPNATTANAAPSATTLATGTA
ncbi:MAG: hypothetical protein ACLP4R_21450 [Solirubrobacteraceae bacterium]